MKLKKSLLALFVALVALSFAAPVFACGGDKTAEKDKDAPVLAQDDGDEDDGDDEDEGEDDDDKKDDDDGRKG